jgi:hypothetical protein
MDFKWITIGILLLSYLVSLPLWRHIYRHISKKPILATTLVDFIYRDSIVYMNVISLVLSVGVVHTLLLQNIALGQEWHHTSQLIYIHICSKHTLFYLWGSVKQFPAFLATG